MRRRIDLVGKRYGRLLVTSFVFVDKRGNTMWQCLCDCGKVKIARSYSLKDGKTTSCGCYHQEVLKKIGSNWGRKKRDDGMYGTKFYRVYYNITSRCNNPRNNSYYRYGARHIRCLWNSFEDFKRDMYEGFLEHNEKHGGRNTSIDRIDVDGNYCRENCRWATAKEQANNTRKQKYRQQ